VADTLPTATVVDVGFVDGAWAVIEANAAWTSGRYTSDPAVVFDVILSAAGPTSALSGTCTCRTSCAAGPARRAALEQEFGDDGTEGAAVPT
jgi:hypothetical protein